MRVALSSSARRDLRDIGDFIAGDNSVRAKSFVAELAARASELGEFPERFPLIPRYSKRGYRRRMYGNYLIIYRVEPDRVFVLRFIHAARNYEALLDPGN